MLCSDLALAQRLERAEGDACRSFAAARRRLFPESGAEWMEIAGACAVFDGVDSPVTQCFGLGIFEPLTAGTLNAVERFFFDRRSPTLLEICPLVGVDALDLLCARNYRPIEISNVLYRPAESIAVKEAAKITVREIGPEEAQLWTDISAKGWAHDHPEFLDFVKNSIAISAAREQTLCFLAQLDGQPGAAAALHTHEGVALLAGSATIPELRRRGLHAALLDARMRWAHQHGCDLAMMVAQAGSESQRNAERKGFKVAYTRTKWQLLHQP